MRQSAMVGRVIAAATSEMSGVPAGSYLAVAPTGTYAASAASITAMREAHVNSLALGFGGLLSSKVFISGATWPDGNVTFDRRLPNRYIGVLSVLAALRGCGLEHVHLLGLGTPILIALAAGIAGPSVRITVDATSPIQDAAQGILYDAQCLVKARTSRILELIASGRRDGWLCQCPFCEEAADEPSTAALRKAWHVAGPAGFRKEISPGGSASIAAGLLKRPVGPSQRASSFRTFSGHNHWVLQHLCESLSELRQQQLSSRIHLLADTYRTAATAAYGEAVGLGVTLMGGS
jgi:hypothetical protein